MIVSLETKQKGSIVALQGDLIRLGSLSFKHYRESIKPITLVKWANAASTQWIKIRWDQELSKFIVTHKGVLTRYDYDPVDMWQIMMYLKDHTKYHYTKRYGDNCEPVVLEAKVRIRSKKRSKNGKRRKK